jgi:hypothetical protein
VRKSEGGLGQEELNLPMCEDQDARDMFVSAGEHGIFFN